MAYFECNLPLSLPAYYHSDIREKMKETVERVYDRTEKLEKALLLSGMRPADFHAKARYIFNGSAERFDALSPEQLSSGAQLLYDGCHASERIEWPNAIVLFDAAFVTQADWELLRHLGLGGSDSSTVLGLNHYNTKEGLWYDKLGYPVLVQAEPKQVSFDRGHFLEDRVIDIFCRMHNAERLNETRMFQSAIHPCCTANLDAVLRLSDGSLCLFEAKTATDCPAKRDAWTGENVPANYVSQVYHYLGVMNDARLNGAYIAMLPVSDYKLAGRYVGSQFASEVQAEKSFFFHHLECNYAYSDDVLTQEEEYWKRYIESGRKPACGSDGELSEKLAKTYRPSPLSAEDEAMKDITLSKELWEDNTVALDYDKVKEIIDRCRKADDDCSRARSQLDSYDKAKKAAYVELGDLLEGAPLGAVKDSTGKVLYTITRKVIRKRNISAADVETFFPDVYAKLGSVSESLRTSLKEGARFAVTAPKKPKASASKP